MGNRTYVLGALFGLIVPSIGIFVGLQVSTTVGNILAFPFIFVSLITGITLGMWSPVIWMAAIIVSIAIWTGIFAVIDTFFRTKLPK
jgi:hypothetical protein